MPHRLISYSWTSWLYIVHNHITRGKYLKFNLWKFCSWVPISKSYIWFPSRNTSNLMVDHFLIQIISVVHTVINNLFRSIIHNRVIAFPIILTSLIILIFFLLILPKMNPPRFPQITFILTLTLVLMQIISIINLQIAHLTSHFPTMNRFRFNRCLIISPTLFDKLSSLFNWRIHRYDLIIFEYFSLEYDAAYRLDIIRHIRCINLRFD